MGLRWVSVAGTSKETRRNPGASALRGSPGAVQDPTTAEIAGTGYPLWIFVPGKLFDFKSLKKFYEFLHMSLQFFRHVYFFHQDLCIDKVFTSQSVHDGLSWPLAR